MKPYYRKNGFLDLGERFSNWVDNKLFWLKMCVIHGSLWDFAALLRFKRLVLLAEINEEIESCIETLNNEICFPAEPKLLELKIKFAGRDLPELIDLYNREKYWWMKRK